MKSIKEAAEKYTAAYVGAAGNSVRNAIYFGAQLERERILDLLRSDAALYRGQSQMWANWLENTLREIDG